MNSSISVFEFESSSVRVVLIDNEPWFVAKDVCKILGLSNASQALSRLDDDEKRELTNQEVITLNDDLYTTRLSAISESGMYALVLSSRKPEAKPFRKWVTSEVLPAIRKTGSYQLAQQIPQTFSEALLLAGKLQQEKELLEEEKRLLEQENHQLSEAVDELFEYSSIIRVAKFNNVSEKNFSWRKLKSASQIMGLEVKRVPCPRFGEKLLYSHEAWRFVYPNYRLPETTTLVIKAN